MKFFLNRQKGFSPLEGKVRKSPLTGFTLIELLVVIGIIAVLSSILYANFNEARMIARDKARMTTLKEVQLALELYKAQNGTYPLGCSFGNFGGPGGATATGFEKCDNYIPGLVPDFIATLPLDPISEDDNDRGYYYRSDDGSSYKFMSYGAVEVNFVADYGHEFARCPDEFAPHCLLNGHGSLFPSTYAVYSDQAEDW